MVEIVSAEGIKKNVDCIGCALQQGDITYVGEKVAETKSFEVSQDYECPIEGFMILASKQHLKGVEDFSKSQRVEFIDLLYKTRVALTKALQVDYVYIIQEEDSVAKDSHFHVWIFPRHDWMQEFGRGIKSVKLIMEHARASMKTKENLDHVKHMIRKIKEEFAKL